MFWKFERLYRGWFEVGAVQPLLISILVWNVQISLLLIPPESRADSERSHHSEHEEEHDARPDLAVSRDFSGHLEC